MPDVKHVLNMLNVPDVKHVLNKGFCHKGGHGGGKVIDLYGIGRLWCE